MLNDSDEDVVYGLVLVSICQTWPFEHHVCQYNSNHNYTLLSDLKYGELPSAPNQDKVLFWIRGYSLSWLLKHLKADIIFITMFHLISDNIMLLIHVNVSCIVLSVDLTWCLTITTFLQVRSWRDLTDKEVQCSIR